MKITTNLEICPHIAWNLATTFSLPAIKHGWEVPHQLMFFMDKNYKWEIYHWYVLTFFIIQCKKRTDRLYWNPVKPVRALNLIINWQTWMTKPKHDNDKLIIFDFLGHCRPKIFLKISYCKRSQDPFADPKGWIKGWKICGDIWHRKSIKSSNLEVESSRLVKHGKSTIYRLLFH